MLIDPQFRNHQQHDIANIIGKLCVELVQVVEEGIIHVLENQNTVDVRVNAFFALITSPGTKVISEPQLFCGRLGEPCLSWCSAAGNHGPEM